MDDESRKEFYFGRQRQWDRGWGKEHKEDIDRQEKITTDESDMYYKIQKRHVTQYANFKSQLNQKTKSIILYADLKKQWSKNSYKHWLKM